ncbi:proline racemase [Kibdelosporangium banguiense]|uniref:Proline racemase n=1 Tax=Kibdelosporangium banguiense TaxID=1365924 RepID=A0ABS4TYC8_9PSEU|nr:proline racemase family protein [Kibdelosporangium banguiense]MBP2328946.1 proline racemase [Kibdelosporangium banguiense]
MTHLLWRAGEIRSTGSCSTSAPPLAGQAWITELSQVGLDPTDPFPLGYTLSDSWMRAGSLS